MRIVFAGTAEFAVASLEALVSLCQSDIRYELVGVYTQPDRPSGRGRDIKVSPVKQCAERYQLPLYQPISLKKPIIREALQQLNADLMIVVAYGLLLPGSVLEIPRLGCINVHASLLPRWRGAAPIQRALLAGDRVTGITIMQMDIGLDTGPIMYKAQEPILPKDTTATLGKRLATLGAESLMHTIELLGAQPIPAVRQSEVGVCYAAKLSKAEGMIAWSCPAIYLERQIRAFNPWPIAFTWIQDKKIRIWGAALPSTRDIEGSLPGTILAIANTGITVATGENTLQLTYIQLAGGRCLPVADLLNGALKFLKVGMRFEEVM